MTALERYLAGVKARPEGQTDESLQALSNDVGLITNPSLRIAASVASELRLARSDRRRLVAMVERTLEYCRDNPAFALLLSDLQHLAAEAAP